MSVIYEPKGKAGEYSELAANLYTGCSHGCKYCYVPQVRHLTRKEFHAKIEPRRGILEMLEKEAPNHKGKEVFLCFTCDPYCPEDEKHQLTRRAIEILHGNGVAVNILTKGGTRALRDFDLLEKNPHLSRIGATLTFCDSALSKEWEPKAAPPEDRFRMLYEASKAGIKTWASIEPVTNTKESLSIILHVAPLVDHLKIGKWNYDPRAKEIDWADFLNEALKILKRYKASYYIKKDLACFSERGLE